MPSFTAGSHVDVHLGQDLIRQYSLSNDPAETHRYVIAVLRDSQSRGGSLAVHALNEGEEIEISEPRNLFALHQDAEHSILLAGGIGITPILSMAHALDRAGASYELHYCCRSPERGAFVDRLRQGNGASRTHLYFDDSGPRIDMAAVLAEPGDEKHLYVCGPAGFIDAALGCAQVRGWNSANLHREFFGAPAPAVGADIVFQVRIASTGTVVTVPADETIVQALRRHGIHIDTQCEQGVCGTCETRVLEGIPDHRDLYLTPDEQEGNKVILPCCSRARTSMLTLDL